MPRWPTLLLLLLLSQIITVFATTPLNDTRPEAYVTLLYGDAYVLPIRVMMLSLLHNSPDVASGNRERLVIVTKDTSENAVNQLRQDGIKTMRVETLDSPYVDNAKFDKRFGSIMTKLQIFGLEEYKKLVFIDADAIVSGDMGDLFNCGSFCAAFINPCYFNCGMMMITPSNDLLSDMVKKMNTTKSYDGGDQGFLNSYWPDLLNAKTFRPETGESGGNVKRRLPFGWHVDHSSYYPRFGFDFSKTRCGQRKNMEFLGPAFAKPWYWWNYAVMDLPWEWHRYRKELKNPYPPGGANSLTAAWRVAICYVVAYLVIKASPGLVAKALVRVGDEGLGGNVATSLWKPFVVGKRSYLLIAVVVAYVEWLISLLITVFLIPTIITPDSAIIMYIHSKAVTMALLQILHGLAICSPIVKKYEVDAFYHKSLGKREADISRILMICWIWSLVDAVFLPTGLKVLWMIKFETMWSKIAHSLLAAIFHLGFVLVMGARLSLGWVRLAAYWGRQGLG